jgi:hypothetical protein
MHGLPPQILGSMEIRSRRGFTLLPRIRSPVVLPALDGSIYHSSAEPREVLLSAAAPPTLEAHHRRGDRNAALANWIAPPNSKEFLGQGGWSCRRSDAK